MRNRTNSATTRAASKAGAADAADAADARARAPGGRFVDHVVARLRPAWIRDRLPLLLARYERFAPVEWIGLPRGARLTVIAPHPDDESIGAGGLVAAWARAPGRTSDVVFLTRGEAGDRLLRRDAMSDAARAARRAAVIARRRAEADRALAVLGASGHWLDGRDGALAQDEERLTRALAERFAAAAPDVVLAPFPADRHPDHAVAARILGRVATALPTPPLILGYEVWSPAPVDVLFDIADTAEAKWQAIAAHESQVATTDYVTAIRGLAIYRGISGGRSTPAEAFVRTTAAEYRDMAESLRV